MPPGLRLPDGVTPLSYDLTLELDPARASFNGHVAFTLSISKPTAQIWLHAVDLALARATVTINGQPSPIAMLTGGERWQMRGFALPREVGPSDGHIVLAIDYTGRVTDLSRPSGKDEEGLFRQRANGQWYLYSQAESIFARRIAPCFDEPRWKPSWRLTAIVPGELIALGNAAVAGERHLPDGRREVRFAEIAALPSYLLAVAVGPFELVDLGNLGRGGVPVRLAVALGDHMHTGPARRAIPKIIDAIEAYFDAPVPVAKLDLVAVPAFFGAMENAGLITFDSDILVGGRSLVYVAAHEIAHQWFGNLVTPTWWDHLWLSEAFATWMDQRIAEASSDVPWPLYGRSVRASALQADEQADAEPLVHPIARSEDIEPAFNEIAYQKGAAVLGTFERFVGADPFRAAVRAYVRAHAGTSVTSQAFLDALTAATSPEVGAALGSNLTHAGMPVVDMALRCGAVSTIVASAREGVAIPVCVRFPVGAVATERACFLAGARSEHPLPAKAGCPAWLIGNAGGSGYYQATWAGGPPNPPPQLLSPEELLARGDDAAAAVRRGELSIASALVELGALAAGHDAYGQLAALVIAREIDLLVDDAQRPVWAAWIAARFRDRLTRGALSTPKSVLADSLRSRLVALTRPALDSLTVAAARRAIDATPAGLGDGGLGVLEAPVLRIAAGRDPDPLFARILRAAIAARQDWLRVRVLAELGEFPAAFARRVVDVALAGEVPATQVWPALDIMLRRSETRTAAWQAVRARLPQLLGALPAARARDVIAATAWQCNASARAEVAAEFAPRIDSILDGKRALGRALASIDRCIARRAAAGDIAAALASAAAPASRPLTPRR
ncbi:MAG TPA: M1 family aminopeptidase [Kofleriaceae bacterium]|nr:M1 family aminopeptidase [Kofleriaceae bacterium]